MKTAAQALEIGKTVTKKVETAALKKGLAVNDQGPFIIVFSAFVFSPFNKSIQTTATRTRIT